MGRSDKPDINYGFTDSYEYLDSFISQLGLENITLVIHDWGSGLGFHYANLHRDKIKGLAFMEAVPDAPSFDGMPISVKIGIKMMRAPIPPLKVELHCLLGQGASLLMENQNMSLKRLSLFTIGLLKRMFLNFAFMSRQALL